MRSMWTPKNIKGLDPEFILKTRPDQTRFPLAFIIETYMF